MRCKMENINIYETEPIGDIIINNIIFENSKIKKKDIIKMKTQMK